MFRSSAKADLVTAAILVVFSAAIIKISLGMPRFEEREISPWTVPGIVPGLVGAILLVLALILLVQAWRRLRVEAPEQVPPGTRRRFLLCLGLCGAYALSIGWAPFAPITFAFVFVFCFGFEFLRNDTRRRNLLSAIIAAVLGIGVAVVVFYVFTELFLIRLP